MGDAPNHVVLIHEEGGSGGTRARNRARQRPIWCAGAARCWCILLEHQSTADHWMVLRLLRYVVRIWEHWLREHPEARRLPAVVPVVVSHDPQGWRAPVGLEEALDVDGATLEALRPHLPLFRMVLDDLTGTSDDALRARAASALARVVLGLLKHARDFGRFHDEMVAGGARLSRFVEEGFRWPGRLARTA
jgi:hypothetical protein